MKRGAMELSLSTIVIVVLAILMLILGVTMITKIGCNTIHGIDTINDLTKQQIINLFSANERIAIKETSNEVYKGTEYGVGFAIRSEGESDKYSYTISLSDKGDCKVSDSQAEDFILLGKSADNLIISDTEYMGLIEFKIPTNIENCNLRYKIDVKKANQPYSTKEFDVKISNKPFLKSYC